MRKALTFLSCLVVLLAACEKPDNGQPSKPTPTPTPTPTPMPTVPIVVATGTDLKPTITSGGGNTKISFTATESWTAKVIETKSVDWITLDKTSGEAGDFTLTVTVKPNTTYDDRSAIVRLQSGTTTIDILFSQKQTDALIVTASEIRVSEEGGTIEINVEANVSYSYKIDADGADWISYVSTKALSAKTLTFKVAANETTSSRESAITISGGGLKHTVKIIQAANTPTLSVNQKEFSFESEGGAFSVEVTSNLDVSYRIDGNCSDWIQSKTTKGAETTVLSFEVLPNTTTSAREGTIIVTAGDLSETIKVSQSAQTPTLSVNQKEFSFESEGGAFSVEVTSNLDVSYRIDGNCSDWIQSKTTKGAETTVLSFEVLPNTTTSAREGTIIVTAGDLSETIKVSQSAQTPTLSVNQKEFEVGPEDCQIKIEVKSNVGVYYEIDNGWAWINGYDQESQDIWLIGINRNYAYESRTIHITFKNDEYNLSETVTITQKPSDVVEIYDQNFKNYCLKNFDANGDGEISFDEAKAVKTIEYYAETFDLHGLDAFINLETLKIGSGKSDITSAQQCYLWNETLISSLAKLRHLECTYIYLNNLDLSKMPDLEYLDVEATSLNSLDVSKNKKLTYLDCSPSIYTLQYLYVSKDQSIPNVTVNRSPQYVPDNTVIYIDGVATGSGNEGTMEGGEI